MTIKWEKKAKERTLDKEWWYIIGDSIDEIKKYAAGCINYK
jgi:hypothetical protein